MRLILFISLLFSSFAAFTQQPEVHVKGAMMSIMHQGDISAKVDLRELKDIEYLFALGAREDLQGEILVWDGKPHVSIVRDGKLQVDTSFQHKATLLVYTNVPRWMGRIVPDSILCLDALEKYIGEWIEQSGFDSEKPMPFRLEGDVEELQWHVIDWPKGNTEHTHVKHRTSGLNGTIEDRHVKFLDFIRRNTRVSSPIMRPTYICMYVQITERSPDMWMG